MKRFLCAPPYLYCLWIGRDAAVRETLARDAARALFRNADRLHSRKRQRQMLQEAVRLGTFRTVAYYRAPTAFARRVARVLRVVYGGAPAFEIAHTPVGGGLAIRHGNGSVVRAESIGRDCEIYQQVTIGAGRGGFPVIGDRVDLCAGSIILGGIRVGDDVIIGAGSVVVTDVPDRAIMVGNPARQVGTTDGHRAYGLALLSAAERESAADHEPATSG